MHNPQASRKGWLFYFYHNFGLMNKSVTTSFNHSPQPSSDAPERLFGVFAMSFQAGAVKPYLAVLANVLTLYFLQTSNPIPYLARRAKGVLQGVPSLRFPVFSPSSPGRRFASDFSTFRLKFPKNEAPSAPEVS